MFIFLAEILIGNPAMSGGGGETEKGDGGVAAPAGGTHEGAGEAKVMPGLHLNGSRLIAFPQGWESAKFRSRILYLEVGMIFKMLLNEYF